MPPTETHLIIAAVLAQYGRDFKAKVNRKIPNIRDGELVVITVNDEKGDYYADAYAYVDRTGKIKSFLGVDDAVLWLSSTAQSSKKNLLGLSEGEIVPGIIAIGITLTICIIVIAQVSSQTAINIPDILSTTFTIILGFYFGAKTQKSSSNEVVNQNQGSAQGSTL